MNNVRRIIVTFVAVMLGAVHQGYAQAGRTLPSLNPFAGHDRASQNHDADGPNKRSFLPSLPRTSILGKRQPGQPSLWQKVNQNTKAFFAKAVNVLTFGRIRPRARPQPKVTGTQRVYPGGAHLARRKTDRPSGLFPWLRPNKQEQRPETVTNWLKQPRVPFD